MAYMRGKYYVYEGGDGVNIYTREGHVIMPMKVFDALVVMRFAEMNSKEKDKAIKYAITNYSGNFGVDELRKKCGMETCFDMIKQLFEKKKYKGKGTEKCQKVRM